MKMITENAEVELASLVHSVNKAPESWEGWMCFHIILPEPVMGGDGMQAMDCLRPLLESCFKDVEGSSFFCDQGDVFTVCKNVSHSVLHEIHTHICDLVLDGDASTSRFEIFDLGTDAQSFVDYYSRRGERFTIFSLPERPSESKQEEEDSDAIFLPNEDTEAQDASCKKSLKVLLVEDDPVTRWLVRKSLRSECQFATAQNGNQAVALYTFYQPDVVFLDINLPDRNGISVLDWIMKHDPGAYVVMFSSEGGLDTIVNTIEDGAKGFISKPFKKEQLIHHLNSCPETH